MIGLEDTQYTFQSSVGEAREVEIVLFKMCHESCSHQMKLLSRRSCIIIGTQEKF